MYLNWNELFHPIASILPARSQPNGFFYGFELLRSQQFTSHHQKAFKQAISPDSIAIVTSSKSYSCFPSQ
jgi:hypothetical protein